MKGLNRVYYLVPITNSELQVLSYIRSHRVLKITRTVILHYKNSWEEKECQNISFTILLCTQNNEIRNICNK